MNEIEQRIIKLEGELAALRLRMRVLEQHSDLPYPRVGPGDKGGPVTTGAIHPPKDDNTE